ncbi:MAG: hypothetical protein IJ093_02450 [Bacilli bacterium]|nr:hypothetical protein [Bacilli bacterium]
MIIIIHEIGHVIFALYYKWNIDKVILLPFGALTLFNEQINRPLFEEFVILVMGPIFQTVFTFLFCFNYSIIEYSKIILFFNLLHIYPIDGSKILNIILNKFISFKKSHLITLYVSILVVLFILAYVKFNLILVFIFSFIIFKILEEFKNHKSLFNKFLLERYLYNFNFKKKKTINSYKNMQRDYKHLFKIGNTYKTENEFLKEMFDFKRKI